MKRAVVSVAVCAAALVVYAQVGEPVLEPSDPNVKQVEVVNESLAVTGTVEVANLNSGPQVFRFVGATTQRFLGDAGWAAMTRACYSEFPGSRIAFSDEYRLTVNPPTHDANSWIQFRPVLNENSVFFVDATGAMESMPNSWTRLDCHKWADQSAAGGAVVTPEGRIGLDLCDVPKPIACAAPIN